MAKDFKLKTQAPVPSNFIMAFGHEDLDFNGMTIEHAVIAASLCKMIYEMWSNPKVPQYMKMFIQNKPVEMMKK